MSFIIIIIGPALSISHNRTALFLSCSVTIPLVHLELLSYDDNLSKNGSMMKWEVVFRKVTA